VVCPIDKEQDGKGRLIPAPVDGSSLISIEEPVAHLEFHARHDGEQNRADCVLEVSREAKGPEGNQRGARQPEPTPLGGVGALEKVTPELDASLMQIQEFRQGLARMLQKLQQRLLRHFDELGGFWRGRWIAHKCSGRPMRWQTSKRPQQRRCAKRLFRHGPWGKPPKMASHERELSSPTPTDCGQGLGE
jgi:hypothetical protein